ncbi:hemerythrin domain-containing protein [Candidatus Cyanaurora vandensis]|uniref:hemerythrin domain-containing protein n=1 Tax=Candidatus Cyanaurora vandensis TaxID=2714958 RepID=UPI00258114C4|nr:hemerythrin domain-containing protein [Candidatus Cyanaurora vandensis]
MTLDDAKRSAIAVQLADVKALQKLAIALEQKLLTAANDENIRERLGEFIKTDQKNMEVLENVIISYGIKAEPKASLVKLADETQKMMDSSELTLHEKFSQLELLKHKQFMAGYLVHKAGQVVGADIENAVAPLNTVNFENRAHQEQLKAILEVLGVRELTGQEPDQGLFARLMDTAAAATGVIGSLITQGKGSASFSVNDIVRADHRKIETLFKEIEETDSPQKRQEFFGQLYKDLSAHAEAEEQTWYPVLRSYDDTVSSVEQAYEEQAEAKVLLAELRTLSPSSPAFMTRIQQLKTAIEEHVRHEENELLVKLSSSLDMAQQEQLGKEFQMTKSRLQDTMARN